MNRCRRVTKGFEVAGEGRCLALDVLLIGNAAGWQERHRVAGQKFKFRISRVAALYGDVDLSADRFLLQLFEKRHDFLTRFKIAPDRQVRKSFIHDYNDVRVGDGGSCTCAGVLLRVGIWCINGRGMLRIDRFRIGLEIRRNLRYLLY